MSATTTLRSVRGAITVEADRPELILDAAGELVTTLLDLNDLEVADVLSAWFTATGDLVSEFPAKGARAAGWHDVPMLCAQEIAVPGALPRCIRVMLHVTVPASRRLRSVYLREAGSLRPDLALGTPVPSGP
jgi:chorismate mutase